MRPDASQPTRPVSHRRLRQQQQQENQLSTGNSRVSGWEESANQKAPRRYIYLALNKINIDRCALQGGQARSSAGLWHHQYSLKEAATHTHTENTSTSVCNHKTSAKCLSGGPTHRTHTKTPALTRLLLNYSRHGTFHSFVYTSIKMYVCVCWAHSKANERVRTRKRERRLNVILITWRPLPCVDDWQKKQRSLLPAESEPQPSPWQLRHLVYTKTKRKRKQKQSNINRQTIVDLFLK